MPAIAPIVINDGADTPVSHSFKPYQSVPFAGFREISSSVPFNGQPEIELRLVPSANMQTVRGKVIMPVLEEASTGGENGYVAPPKVAYFLQGTFEFKLPSRSDLGERKNICALLSNLLGDSLVTSMIHDLEKPY
uniref:Capsid protein n=1 Tax=Beihai levi-like virus 35 TaxID=1922421 RepID=A0A1L3KID4_9VIRU|nr:hypothetical protein [Beihai levi-like virus 35]